MRRSLYLIAILVVAISFSSCKEQATKTAEQENSTQNQLFLNQKPPGSKVERFAPDVVSSEHLEIEAALSPDMSEFYFVRQVDREPPNIHILKLQEGQWIESTIPRPDGEIFISTDNSTMHMGSMYKVRNSNGWTEEKSLGTKFEDYPIMRLTSSEENTYVFDERKTEGILRYVKYENGGHQSIEDFPSHINQGSYTAHPFIAPDESYLIWDSEREGGFGGSDLYISFQQNDGSWGPAINLGADINSEIDDAYGSISFDNKYFFFNRVNINGDSSVADIYWVDAQVILDLEDSE